MLIFFPFDNIEAKITDAIESLSDRTVRMTNRQTDRPPFHSDRKQKIKHLILEWRLHFLSSKAEGTVPENVKTQHQIATAVSRNNLYANSTVYVCSIVL